MPISVVCSGCDKKLTVKDDLAGRRIKCPACGEAVAVPAAKTKAPKARAARAPVAQGGRSRWPWYAGGAAVGVVAILLIVFATSGCCRHAAL